MNYKNISIVIVAGALAFLTFGHFAQGAWSDSEMISASNDGVYHLRGGRVRFCMVTGAGQPVDRRPSLRIGCGDWSNN